MPTWRRSCTRVWRAVATRPRRVHACRHTDGGSTHCNTPSSLQYSKLIPILQAHYNTPSSLQYSKLIPILQAHFNTPSSLQYSELTSILRVHFNTPSSLKNSELTAILQAPRLHFRFKSYKSYSDNKLFTSPQIIVWIWKKRRYEVMLWACLNQFSMFSTGCFLQDISLCDQIPSMCALSFSFTQSRLTYACTIWLSCYTAKTLGLYVRTHRLQST